MTFLFGNVVFFAISVHNFCYWYDREDCMGAPDEKCDFGYPFDIVSMLSYFGGYICLSLFFFISLFFVYYEKLLGGLNVKILILLYVILSFLEIILCMSGCGSD